MICACGCERARACVCVCVFGRWLFLNFFGAYGTPSFSSPFFFIKKEKINFCLQFNVRNGFDVKIASQTQHSFGLLTSETLPGAGAVASWRRTPGFVSQCVPDIVRLCVRVRVYS